MGQVATIAPAAPMPALFDLPPISESQRVVPGSSELVQARYELHRAQDFGEPTEMARWAERWGACLLEQAALSVGRDEDDGVEDGPPDVTAVQEALGTARVALTEIDAALKGDVRSLDFSDLIASADACRTGIEAADKALDEL